MEGNIQAKMLTSYVAQLPGRLFSPSDICKKLPYHFLLHFRIDIGFYDNHKKYQGVFSDPLENTSMEDLWIEKI